MRGRDLEDVDRVLSQVGGEARAVDRVAPENECSVPPPSSAGKMLVLPRSVLSAETAAKETPRRRRAERRGRRST